MRLSISLTRNQPVNHGMLQKELITGSRNSATQNTKLFLKMLISNLRETLNNTALFEFALAKPDVKQLPWPNVKFKDDFLNICDLTLQLFKALSQDR